MVLIHRSFRRRTVFGVLSGYLGQVEAMTDQQLVLRALKRSGCRIPSMAMALAAVLAALPIFVSATAEAKQTCSATAGAGSYWSWRLIDGRKCWYEGKPMLSKSQLEWPAEAARAPAQTEEADAEPPSLRTEERRDPMDAQAKMRSDPTTFDALWRSRIERP
jgi:hypothetical protein